MNEALASHVPKATIEKQMKNYKNNTDSMIEYLYEVRGPGRVGVLVECLAPNKGGIDAKIRPCLRKCGSSQETGVAKMFEKKGLIIADMKKDASFDDAESDAIEVGAEEVNLLDDEVLEFITGEYDLVTVSNALGKAGYNCKEASISYIPLTQTDLNTMEANTLQKLVDMLMEEPCVISVHSSAA